MKALIIYREVASAIRANATLHSLKLSPSVTAGWEVLPWRMDMLKFPAAATEALIEARDAHLMLFAGGFPGSLPVWLLDWLARWTGVRQIKDAALAATAGTNGGTPSDDERQFYEEETNKSKVQPRIQFSRPIHTPLFESHQHWV